MINRYDQADDDRIVISPDGEWCKYEDVKELLERRCCKTCTWRDENLICRNTKIQDDDGALFMDEDFEKSDRLNYPHIEGDNFHVGDKFGCVHHKGKRNENKIQ